VDVRKALDRLNLSQVGAAELLGHNARTARRWIVSGPPPGVAIILQLMLDGKITADDVAKARERARA
jgi:hypothetical protein